MKSLADHISRLVVENNILAEYKQGSGRAWRKVRKIRIPPVKSSISYAVALHEIGHVIGPQSGHRLNKEAQAWLWARENAILWNDTMSGKAATCMTSYLNWCHRRKGAWVPPADHISWEIAKW